jgi:hypothetical protein
MSRKKLQFPSDIRDLLTRRFSNQHRNWLRGEGEWPLGFSLAAPTEQDVLEDAAGVREWVSAWNDWSGVGEITWEDRQWSRMGKQRIPVSIAFASAERASDAVGHRKRWDRAVERYAHMTSRWPCLAKGAELSRNFDVLANYSDEDYERLLSLLKWLERNPDSGLYLRQLPLETIDTKWVERRKGLVTDLVRVILSLPPDTDFFDTCGLQKPPPRLRLRLLCPELRARFGGLEDIEAPLEEIAQLALAPACVLVVENLETGLALPSFPGVVCFMKLGNAATLLSSIPWVANAKLYYWGDIDTHGFAILSRVRQRFPGIESILMDEITMSRHSELYVEEPMPMLTAETSHLLEAEKALYLKLCAGHKGKFQRLEQERIFWPYALKVLAVLTGAA